MVRSLFFTLSTLLALALIATSCGDSTQAATRLRLVPEANSNPERPYFHDFGKVAEGSVLEHTFVLDNPSAGSVQVVKLTPNCGCTVPTLEAVAVDGTVRKGRPKGLEGPLLTLAPGETMNVTVRADTKDIREKNFDKLYQVRITTDGTAEPYFTLEMHLFVSAPWMISPPRGLELGMVPMNGERTGRIDVVRAPGHFYDVTEIKSFSENLAVTMTTEPTPTEEVFWRLVAGFVPPLEKGPVEGTIVLGTQDEYGVAQDDLTLQVRAIAVPDVGATPSKFAMRVPPGVQADPPRVSRVNLRTLLSGHEFNITDILIEGDAADVLEVRTEAPQPGPTGSAGSWTCSLFATGVVPAGVHKGEVIFRLDDSQYPEIRVGYVLHARGRS